MAEQPCIYCGGLRNLTRDHVPPKSLLPRPYRANLRTVPACSECNRSASPDEEYFRTTLITLLSPATQETEALFDGPVSRSFERLPHLEDAVWSALQEEDGRPFVDIDSARITRVATKIVQGLTYCADNACLPANASYRFLLFDPEERPTQLAQALAKAEWDEADAPAFCFRRAVAPEPGTLALWELTFFESFSIAVGVVA